MFNKINKPRFWISGGIILVLGICFLGVMLRFSGILSADKDKEKSLMKLAKQQYTNGFYKKAMHTYEKILVMEPDNRDAVLDLAIMYDDCLGNKEKAIELYKKYLSMLPKTQKKALIEEWIKEAANESLGIKNPNIYDDAEIIKELEKQSEVAKKENQLLKEEVQTLSGKLYTIQGDYEKEIKKMQEKHDVLSGALSEARIRIGKLAKALAESETTKAQLMEELKQELDKQKAQKIKQKKAVEAKTEILPQRH